MGSKTRRSQGTFECALLIEVLPSEFHQGQRLWPRSKSGSMAAISTFSPSSIEGLANRGRPSMTSRSGSSPSPLQAQGEISPGKNALLRCTTAGSTPLRLDHKSFAVASPLALLGSAFYPILVHRLAAALHASSPHSVTLVQLRFASLAVINSWRDLHPQECARAGRTSRTAPEGPFASSGLVAGARYRSKQFV